MASALVKRRHEADGMAAVGDARICGECLALCHEILEEDAV